MRITASRQEICCNSTFDSPTLLGTWYRRCTLGRRRSPSISSVRLCWLACVAARCAATVDFPSEGEALVSSTLRRRRSKSVSRIELRSVRMASS